ncbi:MAG: 50S ribosomal protein L11 methyltransferase [Christensenella sp.]|nr:50S ribosomal protein L11 methyltransferase [Christensenella sp.]
MIKRLTISTTHEASELVADIIQDYSNQGVCIYDKEDLINLIQTYQFWDYINQEELEKNEIVKVEGYFAESEIDNALVQINQRIDLLKKQSVFNLGSLEMTIDEVENDDWFNNWKKSYKPIHAGKLVIVPSWIKYEKQENEVVISMDPGMAFGSGEHETTRMCLELMEDVGMINKKVIDVGTGSGILALSAAALGSKDVEAYDIDDVAVKAAKENVKINHFEDIIKVANSNLLKNAKNNYDVVLANITADVLQILAKDLKTYVNKDGIVIISGILNIYEDAVKQCYLSHGYRILQRMNKGEWVAFKLSYSDGN